MKMLGQASIVAVAIAALFSVSCVEMVVSLAPWFDVDTAVAEPGLRGSWCLDAEDGACSPDERIRFVPGPGHSWNLIGGGKLRYRLWVGEIDGTRYLDFMFLCEPSRGAKDDDCLDLELPLGTHLLARVTSQEKDRIEFRILDGKVLADVLALRDEPVVHARLDEGMVVVQDSETLTALLSEHGDRLDLWYEETVVLTRAR